MGLKEDIKKLKAVLKPKRKIKFIYNISDMTDEEGVIWILYTLKA